MKIDPKKKPFRCKYVFADRYVRRVAQPATPQPAMIRPNLEAMPKGMTMETMDRIIRQRGQNSRMNTEIYLHTAGLKTVASPLDTAMARNVIQIKTA